MWEERAREGSPYPDWRERRDVTANRVPCTNCGSMILGATADRNGGLCQKCAQRCKSCEKPIGATRFNQGGLCDTCREAQGLPPYVEGYAGDHCRDCGAPISAFDREHSAGYCGDCLQEAAKKRLRGDTEEEQMTNAISDYFDVLKKQKHDQVSTSEQKPRSLWSRLFSKD